MSKLHTVNTGTATTGDVLTFSDTSSTWSIAPVIKIKITKRSVNIPARPIIIKDCWEGVEWKEHTSYMPRKSITGKIIIGKMHKRWRAPSIEFRGPNGIGNHTQYAKTKELFEEKLRGKA